MSELERGDDSRTIFYEIEQPVDIRKIIIRNTVKKSIAAGVLGALVVTSLVIGIPILIQNSMSVSDSTATIANFDRAYTDGDTQYFEASVVVTNPSSSKFDIISTELDVFVKNASILGMPEKSWTQIWNNLNINRSYSVNALASRTVNIPIPITSADLPGLKFLYMVLMKQNFTIRVTGDLYLSINEPDKLHIDTQIRAKDLFNYTVDDEHSTFVLLNQDLLGIPVETPDTVTNIGFVNKYVNPFNFNITINRIKFDITNSTTRTWCSYESSTPVVVPAKGYVNFTLFSDPTHDEITHILSVILSGAEDIVVFVNENINISFTLGTFVIEGFKGMEYLKGDYKIPFEISGFAFGGPSGLLLDVTFENPLGIAFNLSYINISLYLTGTFMTQKAIWLDGPVARDPYDFVWVKEYSKTTIYGIPVFFNLQYADDILFDGEHVDLTGDFTVQCHQFEDEIPFYGEDQEII